VDAENLAAARLVGHADDDLAIESISSMMMMAGLLAPASSKMSRRRFSLSP
jgi:hypothetical protein